VAEWEDVPVGEEAPDVWTDVPDVEAPVQAESQPLPTPLEAAGQTALSGLQNVGEGAMLSFRDEAEAALSGTWDDRPYEARLRDIEERRRTANINNPYQTAQQMSGSMLTGAVTGRAFTPNSIMGTAALTGLEGGVMGAGGSQATLESDPSQFLTDTVMNAAIGGASGLALGGLANVAYRAMNRAMKPASQRILGWIKGDADNVRLTTHERNLQTAKEMEIPTTAPERLDNPTLMKKQARFES